MLTCRIIDSSKEFAALSERWDTLLRRASHVDVYSTSGFAKAWWGAYGESRMLRIVVVEDASGRLRLVAPFCCEKVAPHIWQLVGYTRSDYNNIICAADDKESVPFLFRWLRKSNEWKRLCLPNIPEQAELLRGCPNVYGPESSHNMKVGSWLAMCWPLVYRQWDQLHPRIHGDGLRRMRSLLDNKNHRRHVNWFRRQGDFTFRTSNDSDEIRDRLPEFAALHIAEWNSKGQKSKLLDPQTWRFYELMTAELSKYDDVLRLDMLRLDGKLVAAHFGFNWNGRVYWYTPAYDPAFSGHSPGKLLLAHIIRDAVDADYEEVDLLYGLEEYKKRYATDIRTTGSLLLRRSRFDALISKLWRSQHQ